MNREEVSEALRGYLSYKYAVSAYERHNPYPSAGIANYTAMPSGSGAPERFFAIVGKPADMGMTSHDDWMDYQKYRVIVAELEGAFGVLTDEEMSIIKMKWMQDVSLKQIADRKACSEITIKRNHKRAIGKLYNALRFAQMPKIEVHVLDKASSY